MNAAAAAADDKRAQKAAYLREWRRKNREKMKEAQRRWRERIGEEEYTRRRRAVYERHRERYAAQKRAQYAAMTDEERAEQTRRLAEKWAAKTPEEKRAEYERHNRQRAANPVLRQWDSEWPSVRRVVADAKTSPILRRTGFAVVRTPDTLRIPRGHGIYSARFRAARLDMPLRSGEYAIAHVTLVAAARRWVVLEPPLPLRLEIDRKLFASLLRNAGGRA